MSTTYITIFVGLHNDFDNMAEGILSHYIHLYILPCSVNCKFYYFTIQEPKTQSVTEPNPWKGIVDCLNRFLRTLQHNCVSNFVQWPMQLWQMFHLKIIMFKLLNFFHFSGASRSCTENVHSDIYSYKCTAF